jgi:SPW repeat
MLKSLSSDNRAAFDVVNIIAGLGLLLSPWYLGYAAETYAAWNAWIVGAAVTLIAVAALYTFHQVEKWPTWHSTFEPRGPTSARPHDHMAHDPRTAHARGGQERGGGGRSCRIPFT